MKTLKLYLEAATKLVRASVFHPNTDHRIVFTDNSVQVMATNKDRESSV